MRLSTIFLAALPALALADDSVSSAAADSAITTTCTGTAKVTKTLTLSRLHTVTSVAHNTTSWMPTGSMVMTSTSLPTTTAGGQTEPAESTTLPTKGPDSAAAALEAGKVVFAGVAGMIAVAFL